MILPCICTYGDAAKYQDARYGRGLRVHNPGKSKLKGYVRWRCTVCLDEKEREA